MTVDAKPSFPCPSCGGKRFSDLDDCDSCGWIRQTTPSNFELKRNVIPRCPCCEGDEFEWGVLRSRSPIGYEPENTGLVDKIFAQGLIELKARRCLCCGNVQLFVDEL